MFLFYDRPLPSLSTPSASERDGRCAPASLLRCCTRECTSLYIPLVKTDVVVPPECLLSASLATTLCRTLYIGHCRRFCSPCAPLASSVPSPLSLFLSLAVAEQWRIYTSHCSKYVNSKPPFVEIPHTFL